MDIYTGLQKGDKVVTNQDVKRLLHDAMEESAPVAYTQVLTSEMVGSMIADNPSVLRALHDILNKDTLRLTGYTTRVKKVYWRNSKLIVDYANVR